MNRKALAACALAAILAGCGYTIRLDPGADNAAVYVNGELRGSGVARYQVDAEFGLPESFTAKVVPGSGRPWSVVVAREFDWPRALLLVGQSALSGLVFIGIEYLGKRGQLNASNWPTEMFGSINLATLGGLQVLSAPFTLLQGFRYREYYDLEKLREQQAPAAQL